MSIQEDSSLIILGSSPVCISRRPTPISNDLRRREPEILNIISDDDKNVQPHIIDLSDPLSVFSGELVSSSPVVLVPESSSKPAEESDRLKSLTPRLRSALANYGYNSVAAVDKTMSYPPPECYLDLSDKQSQTQHSIPLSVGSSPSTTETQSKIHLSPDCVLSGSEDRIDDGVDLEWLINSSPRHSSLRKNTASSPAVPTRPSKRRKENNNRGSLAEAPTKKIKDPTKIPVADDNKSDKNKKGNKQALIHVNKLRTRKDCSKEMILDVHDSILTDDLRKLLEVSLSSYGVDICTKSTRDKTFTWRRKLVCQYDPLTDQYFPTEAEMRNEDVALIYMKAEEFVLICCEGKLGDYIREILESRLHNEKLLFVIEGLKCFMRKVSRVKERDFQDRVCDLMDTSSGSSQRKKKSRKIGEVDIDKVDQDVIDLALIDLQVAHDCLLHLTETVQETCQWIGEFTQDLGMVLYKRTRASHNSSFNGETISMKSWESTPEATCSALQHIRMVTSPVASSIVKYYPSFGSLISKLVDHGPDALLKPDQSASHNGKIQLGSKLSRDIHFILTSKDANSFV